MRQIHCFIVTHAVFETVGELESPVPLSALTESLAESVVAQRVSFGDVLILTADYGLCRAEFVIGIHSQELAAIRVHGVFDALVQAKRSGGITNESELSRFMEAFVRREVT